MFARLIAALWKVLCSFFMGRSTVFNLILEFGHGSQTWCSWITLQNLEGSLSLNQHQQHEALLKNRRLKNLLRNCYHFNWKDVWKKRGRRKKLHSSGQSSIKLWQWMHGMQRLILTLMVIVHVAMWVVSKLSITDSGIVHCLRMAGGLLPPLSMVWQQGWDRHKSGGSLTGSMCPRRAFYEQEVAKIH